MAAKTNTILRNQSGAALVIALIMLIVITLIALASSYTSIFEIKLSGNKRGSTDAFYAADAGANVITSYISNFDVRKYTVLVANTTSTYNPFSDSSIPNPTNISPSAAPIIYFQTQSGPPRGGGFSALNVSYTWFQVQCVGSDSAGSGAQATAQATVQENVVRLLPVQ